MLEFNLSDTVYGEGWYHKGHVKEFIRLLKSKFIDEWENRMKFIEDFDKLAGEELK